MRTHFLYYYDFCSRNLHFLRVHLRQIVVLMRTHLTATRQGPAKKNQLSESKPEVNALHHLLSVFIMGQNSLIWERDNSTIIITH